MQRVINIAMNEVGYLEKSSNANLDDKNANAGNNNYTKYWRDLASGMQGQPWCNCFVDWIFEKAYGREVAKKMLYTSGSWSFYTPTSAGYFQKNNAWHQTPQKGDIIYFKNSTRIYHVGIVYEVANGEIYTIEGNTSLKKGVVANGGAVAKKSYKIGYSKIAGFGRPNYGLVGASINNVITKDKHHVYNCYALNVRDVGSTSGKVIDVLKKDEQVEIINSNGDWYQIKTPKGIIGWCSKRYIK